MSCSSGRVASAGNRTNSEAGRCYARTLWRVCFLCVLSGVHAAYTRQAVLGGTMEGARGLLLKPPAGPLAWTESPLPFIGHHTHHFQFCYRAIHPPHCYRSGMQAPIACGAGCKRASAPKHWELVAGPSAGHANPSLFRRGLVQASLFRAGPTCMWEIQAKLGVEAGPHEALVVEGAWLATTR